MFLYDYFHYKCFFKKQIKEIKRMTETERERKRILEIKKVYGYGRNTDGFLFNICPVLSISVFLLDH